MTPPIQPSGPEQAHPYPSYTELLEENAQLREQLEIIRTALAPIQVGVHLLQRDTDLLAPLDDLDDPDAPIIERQGPPRGRWVEGGDDQ